MELLNHDFKCGTEWKIELFNYDLNVEQSGKWNFIFYVIFF